MALPKIISVDDHVVEPRHVWQTWLPEKWRERGPKVVDKRWGGFKHLSGAKYDMVEDPEGEWGSAWIYDDNLIYVHKKFVAIPQAAITEDEQGNILFDRTLMTMTAITYDNMRKGCWDRDERVKDMTRNYVDGSLPFPTFPRFCGQTQAGRHLAEGDGPHAALLGVALGLGPPLGIPQRDEAERDIDLL